MRFSTLVLSGAVVLVALLVTSCTSQDPEPVYLDTTYQLRCIDCVPRVPDEANHAIMQLDGEAGFTLGCSAEKTGGKTLLTFSAAFSDPMHADQNYEFKISQARIDAKDPGGSCEVRLLEAGNTYLGKCTADAPTTDTPCQLTFKVVGGIVHGTVYCDNIPNPSASPATTRYLVAPSTASDPAKFEIHGCSGL